MAPPRQPQETLGLVSRELAYSSSFEPTVARPSLGHTLGVSGDGSGGPCSLTLGSAAAQAEQRSVCVGSVADGAPFALTPRAPGALQDPGSNPTRRESRLETPHETQKGAGGVVLSGARSDVSFFDVRRSGPHCEPSHSQSLQGPALGDPPRSASGTRADWDAMHMPPPLPKLSGSVVGSVCGSVSGSAVGPPHSAAFSMPNSSRGTAQTPGAVTPRYLPVSVDDHGEFPTSVSVTLHGPVAQPEEEHGRSLRRVSGPSTPRVDMHAAVPLPPVHLSEERVVAPVYDMASFGMMPSSRERLHRSGSVPVTPSRMSWNSNTTIGATLSSPRITTACGVPWPPPPLPPVCSEVAARIDALEAQTTSRTEANLERRVEQLKRELVGADSSLMQVGSLQTQINRIQSEAAERVKKAEASFRAEVLVSDDLRRQHKEMQRERDRAQSELQQLSLKATAVNAKKLEEENDRLHAQLSRLQSDQRSRTPESSDARQALADVRRLEAELETEKSNRLEVYSKFAIVEGELIRVQNELVVAKSGCSEAQSSREVWQQKYDLMQQKHDLVQAEAAQLRLDLQGVQDILASQFSARDDAQRRQIQAESDMAVLRNDLVAVSERRTEHDSEVSRLRLQLEDADERVRQLSNDKTHIQRADLARERAYKEMKQGFEDERNEIKILRKELEAVKAERDMLVVKARLLQDVQESRHVSNEILVATDEHRRGWIQDRREFTNVELATQRTDRNAPKAMISVDLTGSDPLALGDLSPSFSRKVEVDISDSRLEGLSSRQGVK